MGHRALRTVGISIAGEAGGAHTTPVRDALENLPLAPLPPGADGRRRPSGPERSLETKLLLTGNPLRTGGVRGYVCSLLGDEMS